MLPTHVDMYMGDVHIPQKCSVRYAGVCISTVSTLERTKSVCEKMRNMINANHNNGIRFGGFNPIAAIRVWERVIFACCLYGCNVWGKLTKKEYAMLDTVQRYFCNKIQGFHKRTPTIVALDAIGMFPIQYYIDKRALAFFGKLCNSNHCYIFKKLFQTRLGQYLCGKDTDNKWSRNSPLFHIFDLLRKYDLTADLNSYVQTGSFLNKNQWSNKVSENMYTYYIDLLNRELSTRHSLSRYKKIRTSKVHRLWLLSLDRPEHFFDIARLVRYSTAEIVSRECKCGIVANDFVKHVYMTCNLNSNDRDVLLNVICDKIDINVFVKLWMNDDDVMLEFLLGGAPLHCIQDIPYDDWAEIMTLVSVFTKKWNHLLSQVYNYTS